MPEDLDRIHFIANRGDARLRLDQVLVRRVVDVSRLSRNVAQRWIASGAVSIDAAPATRPAMHVREGATIEVVIPASAPRRTRPGPENAPLDLLYEDEALIVLNKPAGVVVHPSYKRPNGTLLNAVLWHTRDRRNVQPGILTRLDKDTSGLVVIALKPGGHATMQRDAASGRIHKSYLAVAAGVPQPASGTIDRLLARDPEDRRRVIVAADGAPSITRYQTLESASDIALVQCELVTGRTHQIRVHLASSGWPIIGDPVYGTAADAIGRQALHAWRITMPHPDTREPLDVEAPLPVDMLQLIVANFAWRPRSPQPSAPQSGVTAPA